MNEKLFVYGTLKEPAVQKEVIGRVVESRQDFLEGYELSKIDIEGEIYPILVPKKGSLVEGLVLMVTKNELIKIDRYETNAYERTKAILKSGDSAWVYVMPKC